MSYRFPGSWEWPDDLDVEAPSGTPKTSPKAFHKDNDEPSDFVNNKTTNEQQSNTKHSKRRKYWPPRTCRICLEVVLPTFKPPAENIPEFLQGPPSVSYESEEGHLIRPCNCKGSSKYVHESCLQAWRHSDPAYGRRTYWQCPTCGFRYRLERMRWGHWIGSAVTQVVLTIMICFVAIFLLGFVADPIISFWGDPNDIILPFQSSSGRSHRARHRRTTDSVSWAEHFGKGLAPLGLLGFIKVFFSLPFHLFNWRSIANHARSGESGRERAANVTLIFILVGLITFLYTVWKMVRSWSRRVLEKARERVMDVQGDDEEEEEEEEEENQER